ncbi:putative amidohydrolase [Dehalogenimonas formicexedens]|uniref:Putative amidohydrolase n=2 Tax=Dehalogenimonas TaxID=670486 RepID=A0A1P8FA14_9CHLR|nr:MULTISPECIES: carbon-nitrogen hydrolase family protein [Dehalogenimonas]APV45291.1 putative amidohydrolase [Dehalogenimonas formicexedens]KTB49096.1 putative amidohydrolase [Dehalogenimonas alkenigignens]
MLTRVSLLHISPKPGEITHNRKLIEMGILRSADLGATWIITPELAVCGYFFSDVVGTDWIPSASDEWLGRLQTLASSRKLNLIICQPERDAATGNLHNTAYVIDSMGKIAGKHRKIMVHPGLEEGWSTPGETIQPVLIDGVNVGILICADIYEGQLAMQHKDKGAQLLICPAAWGAKYGPGDRWERRTLEASIPLWVCNRTGTEKNVDWIGGESVVSKDGRRLLSHSGMQNSLLIFDWDMSLMELESKHFQVYQLIG